MIITLFTLFPHWFDGPLGDSVIQRARERELLSLRTVNFREYTTDKHQSVDDAPYGGGAGMVIRPEPLARALDEHVGPVGTPGRAHVVYLSPRGRRFDQQRALELAKLPRLALICGHYEAVDQRLLDTRVDEEISLGDFVLTGGEIPAMAVVDAVARLLPGVLGNQESAPSDSFMNGLLEGPHYTRPELFEGHGIPEVLKSGNHGAIERWREEEALAATRERRPDLYRAQLVHPELLRRLARRARPFVLYQEGETPRALFTASAVAELGDWQPLLRRAKVEKGLSGSIRLAEIREAKSGDDAADRARLRDDLQRTIAGGGEAGTFARNLLAEMKRLDGREEKKTSTLPSDT